MSTFGPSGGTEQGRPYSGPNNPTNSPDRRPPGQPVGPSSPVDRAARNAAATVGRRAPAPEGRSHLLPALPAVPAYAEKNTATDSGGGTGLGSVHAPHPKIAHDILGSHKSAVQQAAALDNAGLAEGLGTSPAPHAPSQEEPHPTPDKRAGSPPPNDDPFSGDKSPWKNPSRQSAPGQAPYQEQAPYQGEAPVPEQGLQPPQREVRARYPRGAMPGDTQFEGIPRGPIFGDPFVPPPVEGNQDGGSYGAEGENRKEQPAPAGPTAAQQREAAEAALRNAAGNDSGNGSPQNANARSERRRARGPIAGLFRLFGVEKYHTKYSAIHPDGSVTEHETTDWARTGRGLAGVVAPLSSFEARERVERRITGEDNKPNKKK